MASLNAVQLIGFTGRAPEVRYSPDGAPVASVQLATTETWNDRDSGGKRERTEWHRLVFFGRLAEVIGQYGKTGQMLYVAGKLHTRKWSDKDTGADRYTTEISVSEFQFLQNRPHEGSDQATGATQSAGESAHAADAPKANGKGRRSAPGKAAVAATAAAESDIPF